MSSEKYSVPNAITTSGPYTTRTTIESIRNAARRCQKPTYPGIAPSGQLDQLLAEVAAAEQRDEASGRVLEALDDRLAGLELALREVLAERLQRLAVALLPVEHDHALHLDAVDEHHAQVLHRVGLGRVVLGDHAAEDDARKKVREAQHRIEDLAADVVEVDIGALRARGLQIANQVARLVIDAGVEAELARHVVAFLAAAGDADGAAAPELGELSDDAADRARGRRHHHGLVRLWLANFLQAEVRGDARHAENAEVVRERRARAVDLVDLFRTSIELPAELRQYLVALFYFFVFRLQHLAYRLPHHGRAELDAFRVAFRIAHAPAHVRVERQPEIPDQHLALAALRQRRALDAEIVFAHRTLGAAREHDAPVFHLERSEALEVMIGVAELLRRHGQPPEAVAHLQLLAHPHAAVQLHRFLADVARAVGDLDLRGRHRARARSGIDRLIDPRAGEAGHGPRLLIRDDHVHHAVLQRLEAADRHAELLAGLEVLERGVAGEFHRADGFGANQRGSEVDGLFNRLACAGHGRGSVSGKDQVRGNHVVHGAVGFHFDVCALGEEKRVAAGNDELVSHRRANHAERFALLSFRVRKSELHPAFDDGRQDGPLLLRAACARNELRAHDGGKVRLDHQRLAEGFHHAHQIHRAAAEAAVLGRERQPGEPERGELRPNLGAPAFGRGDDFPARLEAVVLLQEAAHRIREQLLLLVVIEVHRPKVILAMMLR